MVGWVLDRTLEDELTLSALRMVLSRRPVELRLVHHSDRSSQYASGDYTGLLKENGRRVLQCVPCFGIVSKVVVTTAST